MRNTAKNEPVSSRPGEDVGWRSFPEFERILQEDEPPAVLAKVEKTCRELNNIIVGGSEVDQARAKTAMTAYGRSLDLLRILTEARNKAGGA